MRIVVYVDNNLPSMAIEGIKEQMEKFLGPGDRVLYLPSSGCTYVEVLPDGAKNEAKE